MPNKSIKQDNAPPNITLFAGSDQKKLSDLKPIWIRTYQGINSIPWAKIMLSVQSKDLAARNLEINLCQPSNPFKIVTKDKEILFDGIISDLSWELNKNNSTLTLQLKHPMQALVSSNHSQVFAQSTDADIIRSLCKKQKISIDTIANMDVKFSQMVQFRCSDWQFILNRVLANGVWLIPKNNGITIRPPLLASQPDHVLKSDSVLTSTAKQEVNKIIEAQWKFSALSQSSQVKIASWDVTQQNSVLSTGKLTILGANALNPNDIKTLNEEVWLQGYSVPFVAGEMEALAKSKFQLKQNAAVTGTFVVSGSLSYQLGDTLQLSDFGKAFDGLSMITAIEHSIRQGNWQSTLSIGQEDLWSKNLQNVPQISGLHNAIVQQFESDPNGLEQIRIKIPTLFQDSLLWARFSSPYASKDRGFCLYPEAGDEVVVGFFEDDPRYPVILGSMYNPQNTSPYPLTKENNQKAIVFEKNKVQQLYCDTQAPSLTLTADKNILSLDSKGITLEIDSNFNVLTKNMTLKAKQSINIDGKNSVTVQGAKIDLTR